MKSRKVGDRWLLRFELGDDFIEQIKAWTLANNIESGFFHGLGGALEVTLAFYSLAEKTYHDKDFADPQEIVSMHGNIAKVQEDIKIHCHAVIADAEYKTHGGHVQKLITGPTLEVMVSELDERLTRSPNEEIGLDLLDV